MPDALVQLAKKLAPEVAARLRIATITGVIGEQVTTDLTADALVTTNSDSKLAVGDRVALLQQRSAWVVIARLSGSYPTQPAPAIQTPIGSIVMWPTGTLPAGWLECAGQQVSRTTYAALFAVLGTSYGAGSGGGTFVLPDLTARFPLGATDARPQGTTGGVENVTLTVAQMPAHTHSTVRGGSKTVQSGSGDSVVSNAGTEDTGGAGGGGAHTNMPPWFAVRFIIRAA